MPADTDESGTGKSQFHGKLRVRANGVLIRDEKVLLVKINSPTTNEPFWMPPGGGVDYGEHLRFAVEREMLEETGLIVKADNLLLISEYLKKPWHAVEFYFHCTEEKVKTAVLGTDPELLPDHQMLEEIAWFGAEELEKVVHKPDNLCEIMHQLKSDSLDSSNFPWFND